MIIQHKHEKTPLESKKFIAFLIAEFGWKILLVIMLFVLKTSIISWGWWFMIVVVLIAGFMEAAYIGGQAVLDKYVRVAEIASRSTNTTDESPTNKGN